MTKQDVERLMVSIGHAINANNGRCAVIEGALCAATTLCVEVWDRFDAAEKAASEHNHRFCGDASVPLEESPNDVKDLPF